MNMFDKFGIEARQLQAPQWQGQQQPQGLLGRMKQATQAPDFADKLAIGLGGMSMNPNRGLIQMAQNNILERKEQALIEAKKKEALEQQQLIKNRTVQYLAQSGTPQAKKALEFLQAGGGINDAIKMAFEKPTSNIDYKVVDGNLVRIDNQNDVVSEVYSSGNDDTINEDTISARKEFTGLPMVKAFSDVSMAYSRVLNSAADPSGAGDLSLIFNFMKVLDPSSTVREGEFATAQNSGGIEQKITSLYNQVLDGTRLAPAQRADFVDRSTRLYEGAKTQYDNISRQYADFASQAGLNPALVTPDFSYAGEAPQKSTILQVPPNPDTSRFTTQDAWKNHWQNVFTEQQRQKYLEG